MLRPPSNQSVRTSSPGPANARCQASRGHQIVSARTRTVLKWLGVVRPDAIETKHRSSLARSRDTDGRVGCLRCLSRPDTPSRISSRRPTAIPQCAQGAACPIGEHPQRAKRPQGSGGAPSLAWAPSGVPLGAFLHRSARVPREHLGPVRVAKRVQRSRRPGVACRTQG
jgi:hypothetical protein